MVAAICRGVVGFLPAGQRIQSDGFGFYRYILLVLATCVYTPAILAADGFSASPPATFSIAPVSPEFTAWQAKAGLALAELRDEQGHALGLIPSPLDRSHLISGASELATLTSIPSSYDLRTFGYVTPVKNQGDCGSCWAFGSYGPLESWLLKNPAETWDLSENHLKNYHGFDFTPCAGGNADMSTAYLARWSGPVSEADDPYHDYDDRPSPGGICRKYVERVLWFFTDSDIKSALMTYGGMYVEMYWGSAYYNSSLYTYYYSGSTSANHAVTLIGWDDNKAVTGAPANGAWLIKNSWGADWGDNGYFWISYYDSIAVSYAVAFCDAVPTLSYATNYQYDPLGWTTSVGYGSTTAWAANIFTPTANERLTAVGLYAVADATSYIISIYDSFNGSSFSNLLGAVSGTLSNSGYHTIPLASPINLTTGNDFSIVVKLTTPDYNYPIPVEMDFAGYSSGATASPGQSYVSSTGTTFTDITTYSGYENTNVCIRGLTIALTQASAPSPANGATNVNINADLSWTAGAGATSHDVYFGTASPGTFQGNQTGTTFAPGTLLPNTTYYWRIDELGPGGKTTGTVWNFTTASPLPWSDGFESGNFTAGGWTVGGSSPLPSVTTGAKYTGAYGAQIPGSTGSRSITKSKSTEGYNTIHVKYDRKVASKSSITLTVDWSTDGSTWNTLETTTSTSWASKDWALGTTADNDPNFRIRFRTTAGSSGKYAYIDNVQITGTQNQYTLTINTSGSGTVTKSPDKATYNSGESVQLTANPATGWTFSGWSGDAGGSDNPKTITMDGNKTVIANFTINQITISGYVLEPDGNMPVEGVLVDANSNSGSPDVNDAVTDVNGYYEVVVDYNWSGTVTPLKEGYTFEPNGISYGNVVIDEVNDYTATLTTFAIAGYIRESDVITPISDVNICAENGGGPWTSRYGGNTCLTDMNGYYQVRVDYNWSGNVVPMKYAYTFDPNSRYYQNVKEDWTMYQDFNGILLTFKISGYVKNDCNVPIAGVLVDANMGGGEATTDVNGFYEVWVDYNWSGTVTPTKKYYTFEPNQTGYVEVLADYYDQNYIAYNIYDLDCDGSIGWGDVAVIADNWLSQGVGIPGDFDADEMVNFLDFAEFGNVWQDR